MTDTSDGGGDGEGKARQDDEGFSSPVENHDTGGIATGEVPPPPSDPEYRNLPQPLGSLRGVAGSTDNKDRAVDPSKSTRKEMQRIRERTQYEDGEPARSQQYDRNAAGLKDWDSRYHRTESEERADAANYRDWYRYIDYSQVPEEGGGAAPDRGEVATRSRSSKQGQPSTISSANRGDRRSRRTRLTRKVVSENAAAEEGEASEPRKSGMLPVASTKGKEAATRRSGRRVHFDNIVETGASDTPRQEQDEEDTEAEHEDDAELEEDDAKDGDYDGGDNTATRSASSRQSPRTAGSSDVLQAPGTSSTPQAVLPAALPLPAAAGPTQVTAGGPLYVDWSNNFNCKLCMWVMDQSFPALVTWQQKANVWNLVFRNEHIFTDRAFVHDATTTVPASRLRSQFREQKTLKTTESVMEWKNVIIPMPKTDQRYVGMEQRVQDAIDELA